MARFYGNIGFVGSVDKGLGVHEPETFIRPYYGDISWNRRRWSQDQDTTNDGLNLTNTISILADSFAIENVGWMRWVEVDGTKWTISTVNIMYPRIELTFGGVWNGEE